MATNNNYTSDEYRYKNEHTFAGINSQPRTQFLQRASYIIKISFLTSNKNIHLTNQYLWNSQDYLQKTRCKNERFSRGDFRRKKTKNHHTTLKVLKLRIRRRTRQTIKLCRITGTVRILSVFLCTGFRKFDITRYINIFFFIKGIKTHICAEFQQYKYDFDKMKNIWKFSY